MESHGPTILDAPPRTEPLSRAACLCYSAAIAYLDHVLACHRADLDAFVPWCVDGEVVGRVHASRVARLLQPPSPFVFAGARLMFLPRDFGSRSDALAALVADLVAAGELRAATGELYGVCRRDGAPVAQIDRTAVTWFGTAAAGVHLNGYTRTADGLCLWIARRSRQKRSFPGCLDNMVAGGCPLGLTLAATLHKECAEEAGLGEALAGRAVPVGAMSYAQQDGLSLKVDTVACFDLELPAGDAPRPVDGEVEAFSLVRAAAVASSLRDGTPWKPNSAMVTIDFLLRHGCLDGELAAGERWRLWQTMRCALA